MHAGAGGLFRNHKSEWIVGFSKSCGLCTSLEAELHAILIGLQIVQQRGFSKLIIETDCLLAVEAVNNVAQVFGNCSKLVNSISNLIHDNWEVRCVYQQRESNACADWLAKEGAKSDFSELLILHSPPFKLRGLLSIDCSSSVLA